MSVDTDLKAGLILEDLSQQLSDAVVDYYLRRKPAYDAIKTAQAPVSVIVLPAISSSGRRRATGRSTRDPRVW